MKLNVKTFNNFINLLSNKFYYSLLSSLHPFSEIEKKSMVIKKILDSKFQESLKINAQGNYDKQNFYDLVLKFAKLKDTNTQEIREIENQLYESYLKLPNISHNRPMGDESKSITIDTFGEKTDLNYKPKSIIELGERIKSLQIRNIAKGTGPRSFYLLKEFADLEKALINFTIDILIKKGFNILSVPDLLQTSDIESCGFKTIGPRTQVYKLSPNIGLSGTGEMSIAAKLRNNIYDITSLPIKLATVSRCFRAETSDIERERGLYRVHNFSKVEMFGITANESGDESENLLTQFLQIQKEIYEKLNFHVRVLDMASEELGSSAARKFDMEAWLPAKQFWGEISSASNCTDYQSIRLGIRYKVNDEHKFCHTINGTACAIPRILIALVENNQQKDGSITIPQILHPYIKFKIIKR